MPLFWLSLSFLLGILLADLVPWIGFSGLILAVVAAILILLCYFVPRLTSRKFVPLLLLALSLGAARYRSAQPDLFAMDFVATYVDTPNEVVLRGVLVGPADLRDSFIYLKVKCEAISLAEDQPFVPVRGLILARIPVEGDWHYGDYIDLRGILQMPPESEEFSYRDYLARHGIYAYMPNAKPTHLPWRGGSPILGALYTLKERADATIKHLWQDPQAALLAGVLLGNASGIPKDLWEDFQNSGTAHIIAISGFNISLVAGLLVRWFGRLLGRWRGALVAVVGISLYTLLVGAEAPVVRAALMGTLSLMAAEIGRRQHGLNSLAFVAALMAVVNPNLLWDAGFQLSFTATLGLVLYTERFSQGFSAWAAHYLPSAMFQRLASPISEYLLTTLAAQLTSLPVICLLFHRFSLISLLANLVVLPAQPPLMVISALATLCGLFWLPLGKGIAFVAYPFVAYTIGAVEFLGNIPIGTVFIGENALGAMLLWYGVLFALTFGKSGLPRIARMLKPSLALSALGIVTVLMWQAVLRAPDGKLHMFLLDVGNGEAILIQTPSGRYALINGGARLSSLSASLGRHLPWHHAQLDYLIVANAEDEHIAALPRLIERYPPTSVLWAGRMNASRSASTLYALLQQAQTPLTIAETGHALDLGHGARLHVLQCSQRGAILLLQWENFRALMPLGITYEVMETLNMGAEIGHVTALLLAESGYAPANPLPWIENLRPQLILLSVANGDKAGRPYEEMLEVVKGYTLLRTDQNGWIHLSTDGQWFWVEVERK